MEQVRLWNAIRRGVQVFPCKGLTVGSHAPVTCPWDYEPHTTRVPIATLKSPCSQNGKAEDRNATYSMQNCPQNHVTLMVLLEAGP